MQIRTKQCIEYNRQVRLLIVCCLLPFVICFSQQKKTDSLQKSLVTVRDDLGRINILILLCGSDYGIGDYAQGVQHSANALLLAQKINDTIRQASAYNYLGLFNWGKGNYPLALKNYLSALKIYEAIGDIGGCGYSHQGIGNIYIKQSNYSEALKNYIIALGMFQNIGHKQGIALCYNNIGEVNQSRKNYSAALKNYFTSLELNMEIGDKNSIGTVHINIGEVDKLLGDSLNGNEDNRAAADKYADALMNYFTALTNYEEIGGQKGIGVSYLHIAEIYTLLRKLSEAEEYFNRSLWLLMQVGQKGWIKQNYLGLMQLDSVQGNYNRALQHYKMYIIYRDSLFNEENTKKTVQQQMQFEFDKKETQAKTEQEKKDAVTASESRKHKIVLISVICGLVLVLVFAVFVFRSLQITNRQKLVIEKQKHLVEEKQKEILDSIHYARRIQTALLPTEKFIDKTLKRLIS